ncbi:MAG: hypothetical protein A3F15_00265 [Candidatus Wildermuthbacteria bacterium RIFCSPHIGHO2_12_FULL_40_12]|uniref:Uncharacterized protein n=1 Tax=Candidatus Wildermuthbacteria bacterium RIFCSPHIGHO2_12_FULL_40_12 TaxID=1802457 RepID=A0A1G2RB89_9BACT|nr:MAG: hypothetical protein A3F15_00265 [Candidatus Wildermuthbacteria bacterium RIFCSPHIGHO2_12_FULL_40_12]
MKKNRYALFQFCGKQRNGYSFFSKAEKIVSNAQKSYNEIELLFVIYCFYFLLSIYYLLFSIFP